MINPKANNTLNSLGTFFQRTLYKDSVYPTSVPKPFDLWYEKKLYGKVNYKNNPIIPSESFLKEFKNIKEQPAFALNFVVDAFNDLQKMILKSKNHLNTEASEFIDLKVHFAWKNNNEIYNEYMKIIYKVFSEVFIKENGREKKILDFYSFIKVFLEFIDIIKFEFPITKTSFIKSKYCSNEISGLIISLKDENHSIDNNKYKKFILDPNFEFFAKASQLFGFALDKNAPWRLIADIKSPAMIPYLKRYNLSSNNLFDEYYYEVVNLDLDNFKVYVKQFYNSLINSFPTISSVKNSSISGELINEIYYRQSIPEHLDDIFWINLYFDIRLKELNIELNENQINKIKTEANNVFKLFDTEISMKYISNKINSLET